VNPVCENTAAVFTGLAVKTAAVFSQTGFTGVVTVTETGRVGLTVMYTVLDVAGLPVGQP